ncbi:hypothetical protein ABIA24_005024 [Sinorhizobium fredii]|nr:hypothetical protein [Sinorhizobium fredii]
MSAVEKQAAEAAPQCEPSRTLSTAFAADMRVTREILQRIEAGQRRWRAPQAMITSGEAVSPVGHYVPGRSVFRKRPVKVAV